LFGVASLKFSIQLRYCLVLFAFFSVDDARGDEYIISVNKAYEYEVGAQNINALFREIYAPLGIVPKIEFLPSLRGLQLVNMGNIDAEAGRASSIADNYSNVLKVAYPIITTQAGYICLTQSACREEKSLRYAVVSGFEKGKIICADKKLDCLVDQRPSFLAKAMQNKVIDSLIGSISTSTAILCQLNASVIYFKHDEKLSITSYHLVNKKHADLLPQLNASIQNMVEKGRLAAFIDATSDIKKSCDVQVVAL